MSKNYVNVDALRDEIREIYNGVIDDYKDEPAFVFTAYSDEDVVEECVDYMVESINRDMCTYIHRKDTSMSGNFADVRHNYRWDGRGTDADFEDMVRRLDEGCDDERTNDDRDWLTSWFWYAFGTFGIRYNFSESVGDAVYCAAEEEGIEV